MTELQTKALLAGVCWGIWPLMMNRSGLHGNVSSAVFALVALLAVSPFAFRELGGIAANVSWGLSIAAGVIGGAGLLFFNGMLAKAAPDKVASLFVLTITMQIAIPALYQLVTGGGLTASKAVGFIAAAIAAFLLA